MHSDLEIKEILDVVGLYCPTPLVLTMEKMQELENGDILRIDADDPMALEDIPSWAKKNGHKFLKVISNNGVYKIYIKK